jgi:hypothetical protein
MAYDDLLKRYQEAGAEFLDAARTRAEELFHELQRIGESTQDRVEDLRDGRKRNTDAVMDTIRRELITQLSQLSTVTRSEVTRIFETLEGMAKSAAASAPGPKMSWGSGAPAAPPTVKVTPRKSSAKKASAAEKVPAAKKAAATKGPASKTAAAATKTAPAKKVSSAGDKPVAKRGRSAKAVASAKAASVTTTAPAAKAPAKKAPARKASPAKKAAAPAAD